jgi:hypothetical protein
MVLHLYLPKLLQLLQVYLLQLVLDSTYKAYKFVFVNIHPATDATYFTFQGSTDGGSNYNTTITSTTF